MFEHLIDKLKKQSSEITNQYIADVENIFRRSSVTSFQDTILLATLALFQETTAEYYEHRLFRRIDSYMGNRLIEDPQRILDLYSPIKPELAKLSDIQLLSYILLAEPDAKRDLSFSSGSSINRLLIELLKKETHILDWGFGYGQLLVYAALYGQTQTVEGMDINPECYVVTKIRLQLLKDELDSKLIRGDMFEQSYQLKSNHKVFNTNIQSPAEVIHPPLGAAPIMHKENNRFILPSFTDSFDISLGFAAYKSEWPFILRVLQQLTPGQRIFAITTNGAASTETYNDIRRDLIKHGLVECVVQLSENLLPGTSIPSMLWIFSKNNETVRLIDASRIRTEGRRKFSLSPGDIEKITYLITNRTPISELFKGYQGLIRYVSASELAESNYNLSPSRHLGEDFPAEYILLKDVCQINRGVLLKAQELDELVSDDNSVKYITPKHLNDSVIDLTTVTSLIETDEILKKKSIGNNTIVMSKLLPFKTGYVSNTRNNQVFSNGNTYFLQINKEKINPLFLWMYLNSNSGKKQLEQLSRGSSTSTLSISDLKNLKIPKIKASQQAKLAEKYGSLLKKEQQIQESLKELQKSKEELINGVLL